MVRISKLINNIQGISWVNSSVFKKYFQNVSWLVFERMFTLAIAAVVNIYVARYLHPENFGLLNYAISFVGLFTGLTALGLDQILVRELTRNPQWRDRILGTGCILKLFGSIVLSAVMLYVVSVMNDSSLASLLIMIVAGAELFRCFDVINYYYQSRVQSKYVVKVQLSVNILSSGIKMLFVYLGASIESFAWLILLNSLLNAAGFIFNYSKEASVLRWLPEKRLALNYLRESWPIAIHGLALLAQARIDQVMIGKLIGNAALGQYAVALRMIEIFSFVPVILLNTFLPAVTQAKEQSSQSYNQRLINLYRLMFTIFIVVALPVFLFGNQAVVLLFGEEYRPAGALLSVFSIRLFFTNMGLAKSVFTINESLFKFSLLTTSVGAVLNIGMNYVLLPIYGPMGAVVATVVSFTVSDFLLDLFYSVTRRNQKLIFKGISSFWKLNEAFIKV